MVCPGFSAVLAGIWSKAASLLLILPFFEEERSLLFFSALTRIFGSLFFALATFSAFGAFLAGLLGFFVAGFCFALAFLAGDFLVVLAGLGRAFFLIFGIFREVWLKKPLSSFGTFITSPLNGKKVADYQERLEREQVISLKIQRIFAKTPLSLEKPRYSTGFGGLEGGREERRRWSSSTC